MPVVAAAAVAVAAVSVAVRTREGLLPAVVADAVFLPPREGFVVSTAMAELPDVDFVDQE